MSVTVEVHLIDQFRVHPHFVQVCGEEGYYDAQRGWVVQGLSEGVHCYELQGVFETEDAAGEVAGRFADLTEASNGLKVTDKWNYIGSSR